MSIVDITEEIVSNIDINLDVSEKGILLSVYVDDVEIYEALDYELLAYKIVEDRDKYPDPVLIGITKQFKKLVDILEEATPDE